MSVGELEFAVGGCFEVEFQTREGGESLPAKAGSVTRGSDAVGC